MDILSDDFTISNVRTIQRHIQDVEVIDLILCTVSAWTGTVNAISQLGLFYLSRNAAFNSMYSTCLH